MLNGARLGSRLLLQDPTDAQLLILHLRAHGVPVSSRSLENIPLINHIS